MKKRIVAFLLSALLVVNLLPITAFAADSTVSISVTTNGESTSNLKGGDVVTVTINFEESVSLAAANIQLNFDKAKLTYKVDIDDDENEIIDSGFSTSTFSLTVSSESKGNENGYVKFLADATKNSTIATGTKAVSLKFVVKNDVNGTAEFSIGALELSKLSSGAPVTIDNVTVPQSVSVNIPKAPMTSAAVTVTLPQSNQALPTTATVDPNAGYTATVEWTGETENDLAKPETTYTGTITLAPKTADGESFAAADAVTVTVSDGTNGMTVKSKTKDGNNIVVTVEYKTPEKTVTALAVTTESTKSYFHGDEFDKSDIVVKATYDDGSEAPAFTGYTVTYATAGKNYLVKGNNKVTITANGTGVSREVTIGEVAAKSLTITGVQATSRKYVADTLTVELTGGTLVGVKQGETVTFTLGTGTITTADVGVDKPVTTSITLGGADVANYTFTQPNDVKVTITAADNEVNITCANVEYGTAPTPSVTSTSGSTEATYTYSSTETGEYGAWNTANGVGTYWVKAVVAAAGNYDAGEAKKSFEVTAKNITGTPTIDGTATYGQTLTAKTDGMTPSTGYSYEWFRSEVDEAVATGTTYTLVTDDVGKTITVKATITGNYAGNATSAATAAVAKATASGTYKAEYSIYFGDTTEKTVAPADFGLPIDIANAKITAMTEVTGTDTSVIASPSANNKFALKSGMTVADKDKSVTWTVTIESDNYNNITATVKVTVVDMVVDWSGVDALFANKTLTYGDTESAIGTLPSGAGKGELNSVKKDGTFSYVKGDNKPNAGTATIEVKFTLTEDVNKTAVKEYTVTVNKKPITAPTADTRTFTYTGSEQTYNVAANDAYTVSGNKQTNAGTHTVTVALTDKDNTKWAGDTDNTTDIEFNFVIAPKEITAPTVNTSKTYTFNGNKQVYNNLATKEGEYTVTGAEQTDAGEYPVTIALVDKANTVWKDTKDTEDKTYTFTIAPKSIAGATITLTAPDDGYVYNDGAAVAPKTIAVKDGSTDLVADKDYTVAITNNTTAGTATVTVTGKGNYDAKTTKTATYTIQKAAQEITITDSTLGIADGKLELAFGATGKSLAATASNEATVTYKTSNAAVVAVANTGALTIGKVGTAKVTLSAAETNNYKAATDVVVDITVVAATVTPTVTLAKNSYEYDGSAKTPGVTVKVDTVTLVEGTDYTLSYEGNTDAGTAKAVVTAKEGSNYTWAQPVEETFTISAVAQVINADDLYVKIGTTCTIGAEAEGDCTFAAKASLPANVELNPTTGLVTVGAGAAEGEFVVVVTAAAVTPNYTETTKEIKVHIVSLDPQTITAEDVNVEFEADKTIRLSASSSAADAAFTFALADSNTDVITLDGDTITIKKVGTAAVTSTATCEGYAPATKTITVTVTPKRVTAPAADTKTFTYTGVAQTYTVAESDYYTVTGNEQTNAGTYDVTVALKDTANTTWADESTGDLKLVFTISKAHITIKVKDKTAKVGDDKPTLTAADCTITGLVNNEELGGTLTFTFSPEPDEKLAEGTYTIISSGATAPNGNYDDTTFENGKLTVSKKSTTPTVPSTPSTTDEEKKDETTEPTPNETEVTPPAEGENTVTAAVETTKGEDGGYTAVVSEEDGQKIVDAAKDNENGEVVITPTVDEDAEKVTVTLPVSTVEGIADTDTESVTVSTPVADITIGSEGLSGIADAADKTVSVTAEKNEDGSVTIDITADDEVVAEVEGGITVKVPTEETGSGVVAVVVNEDGTEEVVRSSVVVDGKLVTPLDGSATIKVVDNAKKFVDMPGHWAERNVDFVSARELFKGTSETTFSPEDKMTRGMMATVLFRLDGENKGDVKESFKDVEKNEYYTEAVDWAATKEIVKGYEDSTFAPQRDVTREELAVMVYRYAKELGFGFDGLWMFQLNYKDADSVSDWSYEAICWLTMNGILNGTTEGTVNPQGFATRAEVAAVLERFVKLVASK